MLKELRFAILELFRGLGLELVEVESKPHLSLSIENFSSDFIRAFDEVRAPMDIVEMWHVSEDIALNLYAVCMEVLECVDVEEDEEVSDSDVTDSSLSSETSDSFSLDDEFDESSNEEEI